ncbi:MAG: ROK family transcriptional regulator [Cytophagales bacterium]|nr:ROK family transcriptional regulator [Cytophagales bacterium]
MNVLPNVLKTPLSMNERKLLKIVRQHGDIPRHKIVEHMDITAQAIGQIVRKLDQYQLLTHHKAVKVGVGQPPKPLSINPDGAFSVGIKIGRRHTDVLLVDLLGVVRDRYSIAYEFPIAHDLLNKIKEHLTRIQEKQAHEQKMLIGVGVATPFSMGGWSKLLGLSDAEANEWNALDVAAAIQNMTTAPVKLAKDTVAACIAELLNGQRAARQNFLYLYVDTFVGGSVVAQGRLLESAHGNVGAVASLPTALQSDRKQLLGEASLWELEQRFGVVSLEPLAAYGEEALDAQHIAQTDAWLMNASRALAFAIVSGTAFLDTDTVVIDGSMATRLLQKLIAKTNEALSTFNWEGLWPPQVIQGVVGSDAGALGGALMPLHEYFYA